LRIHRKSVRLKMKGQTCNLIARNTLSLNRYEMPKVKSKKNEVVFCAVGNGMIETSYIKPEKSLMRLLSLCWQYINESGVMRSIK